MRASQGTHARINMNADTVNIADFFDESKTSRPSKADKRNAKRLLRRAKQTERHYNPLVPKSDAQAELLEVLSDTDQIFVIGPAGTGKTYVSARYGAKMVLEGKFEKFVLTRPFVGISNERLGFLPGDYKKKAAPWAIPVLEAIADEVGKALCDRWLQDGKLEIASFEHMRGRTFNESFVLLDEAQNTTVHQIKAFLTRVGEDSQVIIDGDYSQSDLREVNGLNYSIDIIDKYDLSAEIFEFTSDDVVRSGIAMEWVKAFEAEAKRVH